MRPTALDVSGFTCFRDPQPTLDFTGQSLFAIAGPTGAGKSSILDAMTFALYGRVPRMGGGSVKDLISHGRDRMTVTLSFAVGARHLQVARTVRRGSAAGAAQLDEIVPTGARPLAQGAQAVTAAVSALIGLDYDAFTHAVVLPQGEFARFLKGAPATRRRILQELLRLTVYTRMRERAADHARAAKAALQVLDDQLVRHADATPAAIASMTAELDALRAGEQRLVQERNDAVAYRAEVESRARLARERAERIEALAARDATAGEQERRRQRLAEARRARQCAAVLDQMSREEQRLDVQVRADEAAAARHAALRAASATAARGLADAVAAREALTHDERRLVALRGIEGQLALRDARDGERQTLERLHAAASADAQAREAEVQTRTREEQRCRSAVAGLEAAHAGLGFDPDERDACEHARDLAREVADGRRQVPDAERRAIEAIVAVGESDRIAAAEAERAARARVELEAAQARRAAAQQALEVARDAHRAMALRRHLHAGDACPVCTQAVAVVPPVEVTPEMAALQTAEDEAIDACRTLETRVAARLEAHLRARAAADGARAHEAATEAARAALHERVREGASRVRALVGRYLPASADLVPERWVTDRLETLRALEADYQARLRAIEVARAALAGATHARSLAEQVRDTARRDAASAASRLTSVVDDWQRLDREVRAVTSADDPRAERAAIERRVLDAQGVLDLARIDAARLETECAAAAAAESSAHQQRVETQASFDALAGEVSRALAAAGWSSADVARAALLDDATLATIEADVEAHERQRAAIAARVDELTALLGHDIPDEHLVAAATARAADLESALTTHVRQVGQLEMRLTTMRERATDAARLLGERDQARSAFDVHARLAGDLKADAFQAWLLRDAFDRIVTGASERLMALSGRYTFAWDDEQFLVIDHDNAQERRAADTLSGGETFLASLALALELSEQVQRAAGAVRLDSLFIDEGFGSLDATALDTVASAIESLQISGRMVGIITHIRELTDRMPTRILVEKHPDGSRWTIA